MGVTIRLETHALDEISEEIHQFVEDALPSMRQRYLNMVGRYAQMLFRDVYMSYVAPGHQQPTFWRGTLGESARFYVTPNGVLLFRVEAPYGEYVEDGSPPRMVSGEERRLIRQWASKIVGSSVASADQSLRLTNVIIKKIQNSGTPGAMLFDEAFNPEKGGRQLDLYILDEFDHFLNELIDRYLM